MFIKTVLKLPVPKPFKHRLCGICIWLVLPPAFTTVAPPPPKPSPKKTLVQLIILSWQIHSFPAIPCCCPICFLMPRIATPRTNAAQSVITRCWCTTSKYVSVQLIEKLTKKCLQSLQKVGGPSGGRLAKFGQSQGPFL